jgi:uncharacterized paraquat-inducible protein A
MIGIDLSDGFIIYLLAWLFTLAFLWVRELWRLKSYDWSVTQGQLFTCDNCHYAFLTKSRNNVSRCPRCNAMCIIRKKRKF